MFAFVPWLRPLAPNRRRSFVPRLVPLDDRIVPAGNVTVSVVAGDLIIQGDNNAVGNQIIVNETSVNQYTIGGLTGTTVNGSSAFLAAGVTRDIRATFGSGNDSFSVNTSVFPSTDVRDVIVRMGAGNDDATIDNVRARNVAVSQSPDDVGNDSVDLAGTGGRISGNVTIADQNGSSNVSVTVAIGGNLTISNQNGFDAITVAAPSRIGGAVRIADTAGTSGSIMAVGARIGKGLTIANHSTGSSQIFLTQATIGGNLLVTDVGGTHIDLSGVTVGGSTLVTGGAGDDVIRSDTGSTTEFFGGNVTLSLGQGANLVVLTGIPNGARSMLGGKLTVTGGNGGTSVNLDSFNVLGTTTITTGTGADGVDVNDCLFGGNFSCNLGAGTDQFVAEDFTGRAGATEFLGNLTVNTGTDGDTVQIGGAVAATVVYAYGTVSISQAETVSIDPTNAHHVGYATFL